MIIFTHLLMRICKKMSLKTVSFFRKNAFKFFAKNMNVDYYILIANCTRKITITYQIYDINYIIHDYFFKMPFHTFVELDL